MRFSSFTSATGVATSFNAVVLRAHDRCVSLTDDPSELRVVSRAACYTRLPSPCFSQNA